MRLFELGGRCLATLLWVTTLPVGAQAPPTVPVSQSISPVQLGSVATKQFQGEGLSVSATPDGAQLCCAFQKLEGKLTETGLWLRSITHEANTRYFQVRARSITRNDSDGNQVLATILPGWPIDAKLSDVGTVEVTRQCARFIRPGLVEEYSVSVDGVRQDFVIPTRPAGQGELRLELDVTGATVEPLANGARLVPDGSGREIAYNCLRVTDVTGRELPARMEVASAGDALTRLRSSSISVLVDDTTAVYPVTIDPTFSDADWISMGQPPVGNGTIYAMVVDNFGNLFVGGQFSVLGGVLANNVAKWDGNTWSALGSGLENGGGNAYVFALAVSGSNLYAGGIFTTAGGTPANRIAKWNGNAWVALGSGVNNDVLALGLADNILYAGGHFTTAGGNAASKIAKWDGSTWAPLGLGMNGAVNALAVSGSNLFAGGSFSTADGNNANRVAKWDGAAWSALGSGLTGGGNDGAWVTSLAVSGSNLYAGGQFTLAGGNSATNVAKWDGGGWSALGSGVQGIAYALAVSGGDLYVGGSFGEAGGNNAANIAKWNGSFWSPLGPGLNNAVYAVATSGADLYVGGYFGKPGDSSGKSVAKWNGSVWSVLGSGLDKAVYVLTVSGGELYVGGNFTFAGGLEVNSVAKWNGSAWSSFGSGINGEVTGLALVGSNLYAGGNFTTAGGNSATNIAKWDGSAWSALGSGINGDVNALAVVGSDLYVGGNFTSADGTSAMNIAKWNGASWSAVDSGINGPVLVLAASSSDLYAGGIFTEAGGNNATNIARWDGNTWSALGSGVWDSGTPFVRALAVSGSDVYAGGNFTLAGGSSANYVAKWNGSSWSPLGSGLNAWVGGLAVSGNDVYAGGFFDAAGGTNANYIAKWDGNTWSPLGSGVDNFVDDLAVFDGDLYVGGAFTVAGGKVSGYLAKAIISTIRGRFSDPAYSPSTGFSCIFRDATVGRSYRIQSSPSLTAGPWTDLTNFIYPGPVQIIDAPAGSTTNRYYRAVSP